MISVLLKIRLMEAKIISNYAIYKVVYSDSSYLNFRQRHDSDVDNSPPRRRNRQNSDTSPPRRRPKNKGPNNDSDNSPPRAAKRSRFDDNYEPRIKREPDNDSDMSPPRAVKNDDEDLSPPRSSSLMSKTLDGKKAGLQNAKALKEELDMIKAKEKKMFENLSSDVSGRNAETKVRGRLRDKEEEKRLKKERDEAFKIEMTAKYAKWNRGFVFKLIILELFSHTWPEG
jgi:pre-mRNA-splicing factor CWC26